MSIRWRMYGQFIPLMINGAFGLYAMLDVIALVRGSHIEQYDLKYPQSIEGCIVILVATACALFHKIHRSAMILTVIAAVIGLVALTILIIVTCPR